VHASWLEIHVKQKKMIKRASTRTKLIRQGSMTECKRSINDERVNFALKHAWSGSMARENQKEGLTKSIDSYL